jgi:EAL domain-containing protein (putative c-di-GMP-specific phosphodiesterase class I)
MEEKTLWRLGMIRQLRTDFAQNRLELWYQPQLNLKTGRVVGAEALLRWRTSDGRFISPATFIPLAEYSGLIIDIGQWVLEESCRQINKLEAAGFPDVSISVNVSIPQFRRVGFVESVKKTLESYKVPTYKVELEITENILMDDPQVVIDALTKLKALGIHIALDDFGTGFSSLSYLQKLPLDRLKVDRSFINDITENSKAVIADTIIELGKKMGLKVIAEGIEEKYQQDYLLAIGCDDVQGFYYAKPLPEKEFLEFLQNQKA